MNGAAFSNLVIRASAGSGKTHQLTNRYLGLLAAGAEPGAILATTFTRKAAGEILDRVLERLAGAAGDPAKAKQLATDIQAGGDSPAAFAELLRRTLRNLHRLRIGTLDSFYHELARSFSLELGLPAGWSICEEADDQALREDALEQLLGREQTATLAALYDRLTQGQARHLVRKALLQIVKDLYGIYQQTRPEHWNQVAVADGLTPAQLKRLLERIVSFDLSSQAPLVRPRADDLTRAQGEDWLGLLTKGLCGKVYTGENAYRSRPIPEELIRLYRTLIQQATRALILPVAQQTQATAEFLEGFQVELWALKLTTGALRFDEVTEALMRRMRGDELEPSALAFRLDGAIEHLLLDEFQDTSLVQWQVLLPMARRIARRPPEPSRSFFVVGDVKQAIFGWRGGLAQIFDALDDDLGPLDKDDLVKSWRSAQPVIDVVSQVFGRLGAVELSDKCRAGCDAWASRFASHTTERTERQGEVRLVAGPDQTEEEKVGAVRGRHCAFVAKEIGKLVALTPGRSIGVLCRKNETVARMIYELRRLKIAASEEGGGALTDSAAVEMLLSLLTLADHPGHSAAWFHLRNSPLVGHLAEFAAAEPFARRLRRDLLAHGYGAFTFHWAERLAPACDLRDRNRLQQLVEMAYAFQGRSTLRAGDFVAWVRSQKVLDPSAAPVRVMTIHAAKGLEFDAVVLPELDARFLGRPPAFVVGRDPNSLAINFVCRYANETVQGLLGPAERNAFEQYRREAVEESLSLLYVAMTRAKHALYLFIPGPRRPEFKDAWYQLLLQTLAPGGERGESSLLYQHGDANWMQAEERAGPAPSPAPLPRIAFRPAEAGRRRGLEHRAPSSREGGARVSLHSLFHPSQGTGLVAGTIYHAWFARIGWLEQGEPDDDELRAIAERERQRDPAVVWPDVAPLLAKFRAWLKDPRIAAVLKRTAYASSDNSAFPAALRALAPLAVEKLEQERRFLVLDGEKFWNGSFDRIVWLSDGKRTVAADVIDYKTDDLAPGDEAALKERVEHYRPQIDAYRQAAARLAGVPPERIAARLVFTMIGAVIPV